MAKAKTQFDAVTAAEKALLTKIEAAIKKHKHIDTREGGHYFDDSTVFAKLAKEVAALVEKQSVDKCGSQLLGVAKALNKEFEYWGELFARSSSIGFTFEEGMKAGGGKSGNPFAKLKL